MSVSSVRVLACLVGGAVSLVSASAFATPNFPGVLKSELALSFTPPCSVCHEGQPGSGTVTTGFGKALLARGLRPGDTGALKTALGSMKAEGVDSDKNGVTDVDQLSAGISPNDDSVTFASTGSTPTTPTTGETPSGAEPSTGCSAAPTGATAPTGAFGIVALAALALVRRRRTA